MDFVQVVIAYEEPSPSRRSAPRHLSQSERQVGLRKAYLARLSEEPAAAPPRTERFSPGGRSRAPPLQECPNCVRRGGACSAHRNYMPSRQPGGHTSLYYYIILSAPEGYSSFFRSRVFTRSCGVGPQPSSGRRCIAPNTLLRRSGYCAESVVRRSLISCRLEV